MKKEYFIISLVFLLLLINIVLIDAGEGVNETTTVEVDLIGFYQAPDPYDGVSIEVPEYIDFGTVEKDDPLSSELKVYINNTGTIDITVSPELANPLENIFNYLFFRTLKSSSVNPDLTIFKQIGTYGLDIDAPSSGGVRSKYCYVQLNLTDAADSIDEDLSGHEAEVVFWAMPR